MSMLYRLAEERDIDTICNIIETAVDKMEKQLIFQWDEIYPAKDDFLDDVRKRQLFVGLLKDDIAVIYVVNKESAAEYQNGKWQYAGCEYRVIHRLCVNPAYQGQGIAIQTLAHIEKELQKSDIKAVRLDVFSQNSTAFSLYLGMGYEKVGFADWRKGRFYLMEKLLC